ncbi:MAG: phosphotransferase [Alphaproteobacteria bacterium]|nr:phosphotransferase [Alphaproteobacteria bacterium]
MKTRNFYLENFIKKHHLTQITWLFPDASTRRYARVTKKNKTYILMDSPLSEKPREFVAIDKILRKHEIPAAKIYAKELRHGFLLLEDFGTVEMSQAIKNRKQADDLYILALDTLIRLHKNITKSEVSKLPPSDEVMFAENNLFLDYYVEKILKIHLSQQAKQEFYRIWKKLFREMQKQPQTLMLYDYHLSNIMVKPDGSLGLLDFQDAMKGPIFYDLISFVEDERYPLPQSKRKALLQHFFELRPVLASEKYASLLPVVAAHRHTRVLGRFGLLASVYNKKEYLKYAKNDWMFIKENIKNPLLKEYRDWLKKYLPKQLKG